MFANFYIDDTVDVNDMFMLFRNQSDLLDHKRIKVVGPTGLDYSRLGRAEFEGQAHLATVNLGLANKVGISK